MIRTQVQLTDEQAKALRRLAAERGVSLAELVREAVETFVRSSSEISPDERRRRALQAVGRFDSTPSDVSLKHDEYLDEAYRHSE